MMDRRDFIKVSGAAAAGLALAGCAPRAASWSPRDEELFGPKKTGHFSLMQISSVEDTIGNSYLLRTSGGKVIMMDGGHAAEADHLRDRIREAGGHVDLWFISHPHEDHMEALATILEDPQGITIDKVIPTQAGLAGGKIEELAQAALLPLAGDRRAVIEGQVAARKDGILPAQKGSQLRLGPLGDHVVLADDEKGPLELADETGDQVGAVDLCCAGDGCVFAAGQGGADPAELGQALEGVQ